MRALGSVWLTGLEREEAGPLILRVGRHANPGRADTHIDLYCPKPVVSALLIKKLEMHTLG